MFKKKDDKDKSSEKDKKEKKEVKKPSGKTMRNKMYGDKE